MRSKVTFILLALNLVLFGYLLYSERPWVATKTIDENRRRVLGPEAANLAAIELASYPPAAEGAAPAAAPAPAEIVRLRREGKNQGWVIASPLEWPANESAVGSILTALQFLEHETSFPVSDLERNGRTLADYGLDRPRLVVTATPAPSDSPGAPAPVPFTLRISDGAAVGDRLYVLSPDGRRVHVVSRDRVEALSLDLARLRSDRLFTIPVFEARALTLQTGSAGSARTRLRRDQARWLFEAPITTRAAKTPVELLINDLNTLQVARFLPADAAPPPPSRPASPPPPSASPSRATPAAKPFSSACRSARRPPLPVPRSFMPGSKTAPPSSPSSSPTRSARPSTPPRPPCAIPSSSTSTPGASPPSRSPRPCSPSFVSKNWMPPPPVPPPGSSPPPGPPPPSAPTPSSSPASSGISSS